uniref:Uncharacterized protein n=1 Tax=Setaria viridis TaxID=4556 RepID=A0A4U6URX1_SETVI|nr:hypothetical protein SEVIR_5G431601v2 [Setaria viridis]
MTLCQQVVVWWRCPPVVAGKREAGRIQESQHVSANVSMIFLFFFLFQDT